MAPRKTTTTRTSRTKADVDAEFENVADAVASADSMDPISAGVAKKHKAAVRKAAKTVTAETVVKDLTDLGLEVNRALADISQKVVGKVNEFNQISEAITFESQELAELHSKDIVAASLAAMLEEHAKAKEETTLEIQEIKATWAEEMAIHEKQQKEWEAEMKKTRARDLQDYEYTKTQERKRREDEFNDMLAAKAKQAREQQEALEKGWKQREESIASKEAELESMRKQIESFQETLKAETAKAVGAAVSNTKREFEHQIALLNKDIEADRKATTAAVTAKTDYINSLEEQVEDLRKQIAEKTKQVENIAVRAVDAAAGKQAMQAVMDIAKEGPGSGAKK